ncbi:probable disease resistance protein RPP1 isoform X2 [Pyrus x bretschneideri]|uniref:probable disease resistance protein RPP1 isoform X2 n=1 Tax=Pyrus x bretschneideri TaxID=225117 RepID=UPI0020302412|nr:probable disease resistance protein RPP1 isoform X2 [Pyrus x bretschneideri]
MFMFTFKLSSYCQETPNVEAIVLNGFNIAKRPLKCVDFKVMSNLILLIVSCGSTFNASLDLPDSLRYLKWWGYPLESLPSNFSPENLVELHMPYSRVKELWKEAQILVNLQVIDLSYSNCLTEVPNLSRSLKLVEINLWGCKSLVEIPSYFQHLDKLIHLDLGVCTSLKYLPKMPGSIRYLDLRVTGIKELPESVWSNENISYLNISDCRDLEKLPSNSCKLKASNVFGIASCTSLGEFSELHRDITKLSWVGCKRLVSLPNYICKLKYLEELDLCWCSKLENFPEILEPMEHLKFLNLSGTAVKELPSSIEFFPGLKIIQLKGCYRLSSIPKSICKLKCLEELDISASGIRNFPEILEPMDNLKSLNISRTSVEQLYTSSIEFLPALENIELEGCNMLSCISKSMLKYVKRPDEYENK